MCAHPKKIYVIPSYLSILKLQNCSSQSSSWAFIGEIEENLFCVIETINKVSPINTIRNLSHILHVDDDARCVLDPAPDLSA